jgi:hypothetical protein
MKTREDFVALVGSVSKAIEFEDQALSVAREFLPPEAIAVLDARDSEPPPAYWEWLAGQWSEMDDVAGEEFSHESHGYATIEEARAKAEESSSSGFVVELDDNTFAAVGDLWTDGTASVWRPSGYVRARLERQPSGLYRIAEVQ